MAWRWSLWWARRGAERVGVAPTPAGHCPQRVSAPLAPGPTPYPWPGFPGSPIPYPAPTRLLAHVESPAPVLTGTSAPTLHPLGPSRTIAPLPHVESPTPVLTGATAPTLPPSRTWSPARRS